jgi:hypothetical protein
MAFIWENGSREDLARLGAELDEGGERALAVTEQVLKIRSRRGRNVPLVANAAQLAYAARAGQRNIVLKARQMGVTTWIAGRFFLKTISHPGTVTVQVAHTQAAAEQIFRIVHRFLNQLPEVARAGALKGVKGSARRIVIPEIDSEYLVETAGDRNAGRGLTITNLHCTELARWPGDVPETLYGLMATLSPEGELVMESTPMGSSGCFWKEWQEAETTGTVRHFFPWWLEPAYAAEAVAEESLSEEERRLMAAENLTHGQIGYRRLLQGRFRSAAKQEYAENAEDCFLASGACFFDVGSIDKRLREIPEPVAQRMHGDLRIWLRPLADRKYLVAVDPAGGGVEGDYTAMQVIDSQSGLQCAEMQAHLTTLETAREAAALAREYNGALLVVERNNHGSGVLAHLEGVCRYENLYRNTGGTGFLTNSLSRPAILGNLDAVLVETPTTFNSERLLRECRTFVRQANGRTAAQAGEHDDCLMAMAIALEVRAEGPKRGVSF